MRRAAVVGGIVGCLIIVGAACGDSDQLEATGAAAGDEAAEQVAESGGSENFEPVDADVEVLSCGRNKNLGSVVVAGTVGNPFGEQVRATMNLEMDILANGELVDTLNAQEAVTLYNDDPDAQAAWEMRSTVVVDADAGPYECQVKAATLVQADG